MLILRLNSNEFFKRIVLQQGDGLYGALIVRTPEDDSNFEKIVHLSSRTKKALTIFPQQKLPVPNELLINDQVC